MRKPTEYEIYLWRMEDYYKIKNLERPAWIDKAREYFYTLYFARHQFDEICSSTAIPKDVMKFLANLDESVDENVPRELIEGFGNVKSALKAMYYELTSNKELYFINEWTLSKPGRKKMRGYINQIPFGNEIMPPKNEFTNVPWDIEFSNRVFGHKAEYEMTVSLAGSSLCIRNGDNDSRHSIHIPFTEEFLDQIIPLVQWERFKHLLQRKGKDGRDESIYQDFKIVLVDVYWDEYDLDLTTALRNHPFIEVLRLVWNEYGDILREKDLVLPWFKTLGWAELEI